MTTKPKVYREGMRVRIPLGRGHREGTIVQVIGRPGRQQLRIALELGGPDSPDDIVEIPALPGNFEVVERSP